MNKVFWLINQYSTTPETGYAGRYYYLAEELAKLGNTVYLITASFHHLQRVHPNPTNNITIEEVQPRFKIVLIKVPTYSEAHSKKRVYNWFSFSYKLKNLINLNLNKPDAILYSTPSLIGFLGAQYLSKHFNVPLILDVRDIWPLTLIELGGISRKHPFIRFLQWIEDKAYRESNFVTSNLVNAVEHMQMRGMDKEKFIWIPNGISLKEMQHKQSLNQDVVKSIPTNKFIVGYTGTLGIANATHDLLKAALILKPYKDIHFLLVGSGKEKDTLIKYVQDNDIKNVTFIDSIPKVQVQSMIDYFDICFIGSQNKSIYKYGVSPNKVPEYLYSGKPIIFSYSGQGEPIEHIGAGFTVQAGSAQAIADGILKLYNMDDKARLSMGEKGHQIALQDYDYSKLAKRLIETILID